MTWTRDAEARATTTTTRRSRSPRARRAIGATAPRGTRRSRRGARGRAARRAAAIARRWTRSPAARVARPRARSPSRSPSRATITIPRATASAFQFLIVSLRGSAAVDSRAIERAPPRARRESRATLDAIDTSRDARARLVLGNPRAGSLVHVGQRGLFVHVVSARDRSRSRGRQLEKRPPRQQLSDERIPPAPDRHSRTRARRAVDPPRRVSWRPAARARRRTSKSASRRGRRRRKWCARASRLRPPRSFFFARARDPFDDVCLTPPSLLSPLK